MRGARWIAPERPRPPRLASGALLGGFALMMTLELAAHGLRRLEDNRREQREEKHDPELGRPEPRRLEQLAAEPACGSTADFSARPLPAKHAAA